MVRFGVVREVVGDGDLGQVSRLHTAIERCFGSAIELEIADSYAALLQLFTRGAVRAAWFTPAMVVEASRRTGIALLAGLSRSGSTDYFATLVVRESGPVRDFADLRGLRAGWVDPWSAAGYLFPRRMLRDRDLDPTTLFAKQRFLGSHPAVLDALQSGEIDVGATFLRADGTLRALKGVVPLGRTASIPSDALCVHQDVPESERTALLEQIQGAGCVELANILNADRFVSRPLGDYALVRTLLDEEWGRTSNEPAGA